MIPTFKGSDGLSGSYVPVDAVLGLLGLLSWALWAYLALAVLLHSLAIVAASVRRARAASAARGEHDPHAEGGASSGRARDRDRAVEIGDARDLEMARDFLLQVGREGFTAQHQVMQRCIVRRAGEDALEEGRGAVQKMDFLAAHLVPEFSRRFSDCITDADDRSTMDQRKRRLLDRRIKCRRSSTERCGSPARSEVLS